MVPPGPQPELQPWIDVHRRVVRIALVVALVATCLMSVGLHLFPATSGFVMAVAGFFAFCLATFVGLGSHLAGASRRRSVAAMVRGDVLGRWTATDGTHRRVEVGRDLAIVERRVVAWGGRFCWPIRVALSSDSNDLVVNMVSNAGYSTVKSKVTVPGGPDRQEAQACARAIAAHHGVPVAAGDH